MAYKKVFRDPVHVNIELDRDSEAQMLALRLINTREVQRLRHVRQLALANLVYHGAEHSRFSHTLGVAHLAKRLYLSACKNAGTGLDEPALATILASAILHDIGHPPFSHPVERILGVNHEDVTAMILRGDTEVNGVLRDYGGDDFVEDVAEHITGESDRATGSIISSQLDADRLDYIQRDGYHAGVPNSRYDLERIIQLVRLDEHGLLFDSRALTAIETYFIARYHLYLQLYYHKTNRTAEFLLHRTLQRAQDLCDDGQDLGPVDDQLIELFGENAGRASVGLTDHDLWTAFRIWEEHDDPVLADLCSRIRTRSLFKSIDVDINVHGLDAPRTLLEEVGRLADESGLESEYYVGLDEAGDTPYAVVDTTAGDDPELSIRLFEDDIEQPFALEADSGLIEQLRREAYKKVRLCFPEEIRDESEELAEAIL